MSRLDQLNPFKQQQKAEPLTACIDLHCLQSIKIGNNDFGGHPKYYSSHATVLEHLSHVEISCSVHHPNQAI